MASLLVSTNAVALTIHTKPLLDLQRSARVGGAGAKKIVSSPSFGSLPAILAAHAPTSAARCNG